MAYSIIQQDNDVSYNVVSLVVDTRAEILTELPTTFHSGSTTICIEDSSVWMLTVGDEEGNKVWKEI